MPPHQLRYLIVGGDSMLGRALGSKLRRANTTVFTTTRHPSPTNPQTLHLDLSDIDESWHPPVPFDVAVLCTGITSLDQCRNDPAGSAKINVNATSLLASSLQAHGTFVVYPSTNLVFDGSTPFRSPQDSPSPVTEYGRQKAETEKRIARNRSQTAIVRFTKILGPDNALFAGWRRALQNGEPVRAFSDMTFSPVPLFCALNALELAASRRMPGIFHVSGNEDVSYEAAARIGANALGADPALVQPIRARQNASAGSELPPLFTTLNMSSPGWDAISPPDVQSTIKAAFVNPGWLAGT